MRYVTDKKVTQCYHGCPFFKVAGKIMECNHPELEGGTWENKLIINQDNSRGQVPEKCPLRISSTEVVVKVSYE